MTADLHNVEHHSSTCFQDHTREHRRSRTNRTYTPNAQPHTQVPTGRAIYRAKKLHQHVLYTRTTLLLSHCRNERGLNNPTSTIHKQVTRIVSAKQPPAKDARDWYPYYAGFTQQFVESVLHQYLPDAETILDPWSGSGTTSLTCLTNSVQSTGLDINPALTVISRARLVPATMAKTLIQLAETICDVSTTTSPKLNTSDLLLNWLVEDKLESTRQIEAAIHQICETRCTADLAIPLESLVDDYSPLLCFYYTALFSTIRATLQAFRTTNPMWIKTRISPDERVYIAPTDLNTSFRTAVDTLAKLLSYSGPTLHPTEIPFATRDSTRLPFPRHFFDGVITSPPYATRLDYVMGTLPELAVLGATERFTNHLRTRVTGTPVVQYVPPSASECPSSETANELLSSIKNHVSKGSKSYYLPWMRHYLLQLEQSIAEINRTVTPDGTICLVVQDSRYKEIHIHLQRVVAELFQVRGRQLRAQIDHPVTNKRFIRRDLDSNPSSNLLDAESLLVFGSSNY